MTYSILSHTFGRGLGLFAAKAADLLRVPLLKRSAVPRVQCKRQCVSYKSKRSESAESVAQSSRHGTVDSGAWFFDQPHEAIAVSAPGLAFETRELQLRAQENLGLGTITSAPLRESPSSVPLPSDTR